MTADLASLLAAGIPKPMFYAWSALVIAVSVVGHLRLVRRCRRFVRETGARLQQLKRRSDEYEAKVEAELARMRAELDAYGAWSDANDRFFHHGLVAVSHLLGARALPERRTCMGERRSTPSRRASATVWRPKPRRVANPASSSGTVIRVQRRTCS